MDVAWTIRKLRDLADIRVSNVDKKVHANEKAVKLCNYMDVYSNDYVTSRIQFMDGSASAAEIERFRLNCGDVIITKDSETPDDIGIPTVISEEIDDLVCGYHLALIRPNADQIDPTFLSKQLSTSRVARYFSLYASGSTRYGLPVSVIESIEIPTPPKHEQTKIAEILSTVDRAIEQTEALIAKKQLIKAGLMQDLLTRGIDEHGYLRSEQTHKFKDSLLGKIPVEWELVQLSSYIAFIRSGLSRRIQEIDIGVPVITSTNIQRSRLDTTQLSYWYLKDPQGAKTASFFLDDGDILLNFINSVEQIGKVCMFEDLGRPTIYTTNLFRIKAGQAASQVFLFHLLDSQVVQNEIKLITKPAVNQASFTISDFLGITVPLIPYDEQLRIVEFLIALNNHNKGAMLSLTKLKQEKNALMQDLLTGKKRVTPLLNDTEVMSG